MEQQVVARYGSAIPIPALSHRSRLTSLNHMLNRLFSSFEGAIEGGDAARDGQKRDGGNPNAGRRAKSAPGKTYFRLLAAKLRRQLEDAGSKEGRVKILNARKSRELNIRKFWLPFIDVLQKASSTDLAIEVFNWQRKELRRSETPKHYAKMIAFAGAIGRPNLALSWFEDMGNRKLAKTTSSCNALIFAFSKNREPEKALAIFETMKGLDGCQHNLVTYNTLISMHGSMGELEKMEQAFEECQTTGFAPERITYNTLLHAYLKNGKLDKLEDVYKMMLANGCKPDVVTFNALMLGYCRALSVEKMETGLRDMLTASIPVTAMVAEEMVRVYMKSGLVDRVEKVIEIIENTPLTRYTTQLHSVILECYANAGQLDSIEAHFERILNRKKEFVSSSVLEAVMNAFATERAFERLHNLYLRLKQSECWDLFAFVYELLIIEYAKAELFDKMDQILMDMEKTDHRPSAKTLQAVYEGRKRAGNEAGAQEIHERITKDSAVQHIPETSPVILPLVKSPSTA